MSIVQISKIIHRTGSSHSLPDRLDTGEIGFTEDTGEVFIGASNNPKVSGRKSYPYQNIKILTEFDVQYGISGDVYYHGPLKNLYVPNFGNAIELFEINDAAIAQYGTYDFSISSNDGCVSGQIFIAHHRTSGLSINVPNIGASAGNSPNVSFTAEKVNGNKIVLKANNLNISTSPILSLSGRQWSVYP